MTPTTAAILAGNAQVIAGLAAGDAGPDYAAAQLGVVAMLGLLAAQEAMTGAAVRVSENRAIRTLLGEDGTDDDLTIAALDAANADLRRRLIARHERIEGEATRNAEVLALYRIMAEGRMLALPTG